MRPNPPVSQKVVLCGDGVTADLIKKAGGPFIPYDSALLRRGTLGTEMRRGEDHVSIGVMHLQAEKPQKPGERSETEGTKPADLDSGLLSSRTERE